MTRSLGLWVTISSYAFTDEMLGGLLEYRPAGVRINMGRESFEWANHAISLLSGLGYQPARIFLDIANDKPRVKTVGGYGSWLELRAGHEVRLVTQTGDGNDTICVSPAFAAPLRSGNVIIVGDGLTNLTVRAVDESGAVVVAESSCSLADGTSLHLIGYPGAAHTLSDREEQLTQQTLEQEPVSLVLSFVEERAHIDTARERFPRAKEIIPKLETKFAARSLTSLVRPGETFMLGRGDLGLSVGFANTGYFQDLAMRSARSIGAEGLIAGGILEGLSHNLLPTRAEVNDVYVASEQRALGIVLTSETAGSKDPLRVVKVARYLVDELEKTGELL